MKIYICVPERISRASVALNNLREEFYDVLAAYYNNLQASDILFCESWDGKVRVFVMGKTDQTGSEQEIAKKITEIFSLPVDVKLNYHVINPNFKPAEPDTHPPVEGPDDPEGLSRKFSAEKPLYTFEQVILPQTVKSKIYETIAMMRTEIKHKVFDEWGLRNIVPNPVSALNFYGLPGTGKTMAAEAVASSLGKPIIRASYADIESKWHGEGPKMVKAVFLAAKRDDAVLFIDEADSLLSKRLTDVQSGSEQVINSMRSQLLIALEHFDGVVIFATNLIVNYDKAFISRLVCIEIPAPDVKGRQAIWEQHIRGKGINIPLSDDVDTYELAEKYDTDFHGREIRKAVIRACVTCAMKGKDFISQSDFMDASEKVKTETEGVQNAADHTESTLKELMQSELDKHKTPSQ